MDIHAIDTVSTTQRPFDSTTLHTFSIREPGSAITHGIAMVFALIGAIPLMRRAVTGGTVTWIAAFIFCASMILLYGASTAFHTFDINPRVNTILKKADHMMISVFIAGSYTPICLLVLPEPTGLILLAVVWGLALAGIIIKSFFVFCPKWVSSILYIGMDLSACPWNDLPEHGSHRFRFPVCRRTDLHDRRRDLRVKASGF